MKLLLVLLALMTVIMSVNGTASQCICECPQTPNYDVLPIDDSEPEYTPRQRQYFTVQSRTPNMKDISVINM